MSETRRKIAVIVLAAFGIFCLISVIDDMSKWTVFCPSSVTVEAVVTGNKETYYTKGSYHYRYTPYVSYTVNDKQYDNVLVETGAPDPVTPYPVGSSMTLVYIHHPDFSLGRDGVGNTSERKYREI